MRPRAVVVSADPLQGGAISSVFELRLEDGAGLVVKVYSLLPWELGKEAFVYELVRRSGADVPMATILATDDSRALLPHGYALMTKLDGEALADAQATLREPETAAIQHEVGTLLRRLHEIELDAFGYVGAGGVLDPEPTNDAYMGVQFDKRLRAFADHGGDTTIRRRIEAHVAERAELFTACKEPVLCHNDCHDANVLVSAGRVSGIVDFGNAVGADPLLDLAKTTAYSRWPDEARLTALTGGHGDLRDGWRDALALYELYHRLELWWWFVSTGTGSDALPGIEATMAQQVGL